MAFVNSDDSPSKPKDVKTKSSNPKPTIDSSPRNDDDTLSPKVPEISLTTKDKTDAADTGDVEKSSEPLPETPPKKPVDKADEKNNADADGGVQATPTPEGPPPTTPEPPKPNEIEEEAETPQDKSQEEIHKIDSVLIQIQLVLLLLTLISGYTLRKKKIIWIHETGLALLYGLIAGLIIYAVTSTDKLKGLPTATNKPSASYRSESLTCSVYQPATKKPNGTKVAPPTKSLTSPNHTIAIQIPVNTSIPLDDRKYDMYTYKLLGKVNEAESARFDDELKKITFDAEIFFQLLLPPIIFYAAYSMRKRHFFRNIGAILTFAFVGTLISCFVTACIVYVFVWTGQKVSDTLSKFTFEDCLYFGAIISATDPVTVLAVFSDKRVDVDLDAMIFGESILNDAVAIVLAGAIRESSATVQAPAADSGFFIALGDIVASFFAVFFGSFGIGAAIGILNAVALKFIPLTSEPVVESSLFVLVSWSAFLTAESLGASGIVSVLFAGIVQAQYTQRNMSPQSQQGTKEFFHMLSFIAENFVFCYMGLTMATSQHSWSIWFILGSFIAIIVGRAANIYPLSFLLNLGRGKKIPMRFQHMMMWSGLRGAMAFALAIRETLTSTDQTIFSTTLLICYLTVWILGSGTSYMLNKLHIEVNVDPDADLKGGPGSQQCRPSWVFRQWHKFDRQVLRPLLIRPEPQSDETPVLPESTVSNAHFSPPTGAIRLEEEGIVEDDVIFGSTM